MCGGAVADAIPLAAELGVVTVGGDLHDGAGCMFVVPAEFTDAFGLPAVAPEFEAIAFHRVDSEFRLFAAADPFGPGVSEE